MITSTTHADDRDQLHPPPVDQKTQHFLDKQKKNNIKKRVSQADRNLSYSSREEDEILTYEAEKYLKNIRFTSEGCNCIKD